MKIVAIVQAHEEYLVQITKGELKRICAKEYLSDNDLRVGTVLDGTRITDVAKEMKKRTEGLKALSEELVTTAKFLRDASVVLDKAIIQPDTLENKRVLDIPREGGDE